MSRTKTYTLVGLAADANDISAAAAITADTPITLLAAAAALDPPRFLSFVGSAALTGTFAVVGLDRWGNRMTETVSGVTTTPVRTKGVYSSVTSITPSDTDADTLAVGWPVGGVATPWVLCGRGLGTDAVPEALLSVLTVSGSPDGNVEVTYDMFPRLPEAQITVDQSVLAASFAPGTPVAAKGQGIRFVMTAEGTCTVKITRSGPG